MKEKIALKSNVAETLFITLYMKALESKRYDPILYDEHAAEIMDQIDYDFEKYNNAKRSAIGVVVRAKHFDDQIRRFIHKNENPVVVLLECGLDARYQRLKDCNHKARFYELDLPEVMDMRKNFLPESKNDQYISASMFDTLWMDQLKEKHPKSSFIFIIEGVVMYFGERELKIFFKNLSIRFVNSEIHFDIVSKWLANNSHKHDTLKHNKARFVSGFNDDSAFEYWSDNLKLSKSYLYSDFPGWKRVGWMQRTIMSVIPKFKYGGRILAYQII